MTSTSEHRIIARRYLGDLWSRGLLATADTIVAPSCELRDPLCGLRCGPDAIKAAVCELRLAFPDLAFSLDDFLIEAGDQLALRWSAHGTHRAPLLGIPCTDRRFCVSGLLLLRYRAGKLVAITTGWDPIALLEQLGMFEVAEAPRSRLARGSSPLVETTPARGATTPSKPPEGAFARAASQPESELDAGWG
ncbi:MAG TPA: ester cyclase [Kofleriaceae bacterium]|jgi:predicted ester cyclase|nr:ester cyclase [Kofleriaceae bacterium]